MKKSIACLVFCAGTLALYGCAETEESAGGVTVVVSDSEASSDVVAQDAHVQFNADSGVSDTDGSSNLTAPLDSGARVDSAMAPPGDGDSDGDGYSDAEERHAGTDPNDPDSVIYQGGWPYNMNKDQLEDPGWDIPPQDGARMPRWRTIDQYGDTFDLYDLAGRGKKIVLDVGTWFCTPCKAMAQYFATGDVSVMDDFAWWNSSYDRVLDMINNEEIIWVTVLFSGSTPVSQEDVTRWHDTFPNHHILVLGDQDLRLREYLSVVAMPHIDVLDENMNFLVYDVRGPSRGMRHLVAPE